MASEQSEKDKKDADNKDAAVKPDPETLNTTDPQEHMEGPVSSLVQEAGETFEDKESEDEVRKKDT